MQLAQFRQQNDLTPDVEEERPSGKMVIIGPVDKTVEAKPANDDDDDDLDWSYEIDSNDLNDLKEVYNFLDRVIEGILKDQVKMPIELIRELEVAINDVHTLINEFEPFKQQDAGQPCIAVTLEDAFRDDLCT